MEDWRDPYKDEICLEILDSKVFSRVVDYIEKLQPYLEERIKPLRIKKVESIEGNDPVIFRGIHIGIASYSPFNNSEAKLTNKDVLKGLLEIIYRSERLI